MCRAKHICNKTIILLYFVFHSQPFNPLKLC